MSSNNNAYFALALQNGLIFGAASIVLNLIVMVTGLTANVMMGTVLFIVSLLLYYFGASKTIKEYRDRYLDGFISIGQAFVPALITCLAIGFLSMAFNYVYVNFIDDAHLIEAAEMSLEVMENFGMDAEEAGVNIDDIVEGQKGLGNMLFGFLIGGGIFGSLMAIVASAIHARKPASA